MQNLRERLIHLPIYASLRINSWKEPYLLTKNMFGHWCITSFRNLTTLHEIYMYIYIYYIYIYILYIYIYIYQVKYYLNIKVAGTSLMCIYSVIGVVSSLFSCKKNVCRSYPSLSIYKHDVYLNYWKSLIGVKSINLVKSITEHLLIL